MDKMFNWTSVVTGLLGGCFAWLFGTWDKLLGALLTFVLLDFITGVMKATYKNTLSSDICYQGIVRKISIFIMVAAANIVQKITGDSVALREIVIMFFIANEGISLLENCAEVSGTRIPQKLKDVLLQLRGDDESEGAHE